MIRLCIFNISCNRGSSIINNFSLSPEKSIIKAFLKKDININKNLSKLITINKYDSINNILNDKYVNRIWNQKYGYFPTQKDVDNIYQEYIRYQLYEGVDNIEIKPGLKSCIHKLSENNITTGVISQYNKPITMSIKDRLNSNDIFIDKYVTKGCMNIPTKLNMIHNIMMNINLYDPKKVIIIDNNIKSIKEYNNLGYHTIGITGYRWRLKDELISSGISYVSDNLEIMPIINHINKK